MPHGYWGMTNSKVIHHPGVIVEMMEDYYSHCAGVDFHDIKIAHGAYLIGKDYYLYRDLMDKDLEFYERAYRMILKKSEYKDKILKNETRRN